MPATLTQLEERLDTCASNYDLEGLVTLSHGTPLEDTVAWREVVLNAGFFALFGTLLYDQACGKLSDGGLDFIDEVLGAAEAFHGAPLPVERAQALSLRVEALAEASPPEARAFAEQAMHGLIGVEGVEAASWRARLHEHLFELEPAQALAHWRAAVAALGLGGETLPPQLEVGLALRLLYTPRDVPGFAEVQAQAVGAFRRRLDARFLVNPDGVWVVLEDAVRQPESPLLEHDIVRWLARSATCTPTQPERLRQAGLLCHKQAKLRRSEELFTRACTYFEAFIAQTPAHAMEVSYLRATCEDHAALLDEQGRHDDAEARLAHAWAVCREHEAVVRLNFSPLIQTAEFYERLRRRPGACPRPEASHIIDLAREAERLGQGSYSGPGLVLLRLALAAHDSALAVHHLTRLLLLHELCIEEQLQSLLEVPFADGVFLGFVRQTLAFMSELRPGYFFDPCLRAEALDQLSVAQTAERWARRQAELRARPPLARHVDSSEA